jgi:hypothetical protein
MNRSNLRPKFLHSVVPENRLVCNRWNALRDAIAMLASFAQDLYHQSSVEGVRAQRPAQPTV